MTSLGPYGRFFVDDVRVDVLAEEGARGALEEVLRELSYGLVAREGLDAGEVRLSVRSGAVRERPAHRVVFTQEELSIAQIDDGWHVWAPRVSARVRCGALLAIDATLDEIGPGPRVDEVLWVALLLALRERARFHVHSALVDAPAGRWMLVGPSGSGKSTTAIILRAAGLAPLGDDASLIRPDGCVTALPRRFHLSRRALRVAPDLGAGVPHTRDRYAVDVTTGPGRPEAISAVIILRGAAKATALRRCPPTTALVALMEESTLLFLDGAPLVVEHMQALSRIVEGATTLELSPGPDVIERPRVLREAIEAELAATDRAQRSRTAKMSER